MKNNIYILFFALAIVLNSSCKTNQKRTVVVKKDADTIVTGVKTENDSVYALLRQQNSWYSSRLSIELSSSGSDEISAFLVNRRDSIIYLNINKFGIELARAIFTPDSILMVNRFEKTYYKGDYSIITRMYGVSLSFDFIQSILVCEDFKDCIATSISTKTVDSTLLISIPRRTNDRLHLAIHQEITVQRANGKIVNNWIKDINTQQVANVSYQEFENIDGYVFPKSYTIELPGTKINIKTKSTKVNIPGPTSLIVPAKYTPMFPLDGNR